MLKNVQTVAECLDHNQDDCPTCETMTHVRALAPEINDMILWLRDHTKGPSDAITVALAVSAILTRIHQIPPLVASTVFSTVRDNALPKPVAKGRA